MRHPRRASVYVVVLFTTVAVVAMVLGGLGLQNSSRRGVMAAGDMVKARALADSAVELGLQLINSDTARVSLSGTGAWLTNVAVGKGTLSVAASDPGDGNLTNSNEDPITLVGTGVYGTATQRVQATASAVFSPMPVITHALVTPGNITFTSASYSGTNKAVTGGSANASSSVVLGPVQTVAGTVGGNFSGTVASGAMPTIPTLGQASAPYTSGRAKGSISLLSLGTLSGTVVAPGSNPFGVANAADGVYVVDLANGSLTIKDCRIVGTLVLLNAKGGVSISGSVSWEPFKAGYPALIVDGNVSIALSASALSEAGMGVNLNAPALGLSASNNTLTDTYPSMIRGLVYAAGTITTSGVTTVQGVLIGTSTAAVSGALIIRNDPNLSIAPPPGFRTGPTMVVQAGSWKQLVQ